MGLGALGRTLVTATALLTLVVVVTMLVVFVTVMLLVVVAGQLCVAVALQARCDVQRKARRRNLCAVAYNPIADIAEAEQKSETVRAAAIQQVLRERERERVFGTDGGSGNERQKPTKHDQASQPAMQITKRQTARNILRTTPIVIAIELRRQNVVAL
jgi:hypothetical protein